MRQVVVETPTKPENRRPEVNRRFRRLEEKGTGSLAIYICLLIPKSSSSSSSSSSSIIARGVARNGARETREKTRKGMRGVCWEAHVTSRDPTLDAVGTRSCAIRRGMSKKRATREKPRTITIWERRARKEERSNSQSSYSLSFRFPTRFYRFAVSPFVFHRLTSHLSPLPVADTPTRRFADTPLASRRFRRHVSPVAYTPFRRHVSPPVPLRLR